jgi:uncharacterized repeat protein (TIGR03803 family)
LLEKRAAFLGTPWAGVVEDAAGNLYGSTIAGGKGNEGVVFAVDPLGDERVIHAFMNAVYGGVPFGSLAAINHAPTPEL